MDQKFWIWICSVIVSITISNCVNHHNSTAIIKCEYYNNTLCESSHGEHGCGNETQECTTENDKQSYCYAVWKNNTKTNQLVIKLKVI